MMKKKIIWIVNEYNGPSGIWTRQTMFSQLLSQRGYEVYLICGNPGAEKYQNPLKSEDKFQVYKSAGATFYAINTFRYSSNIGRVLVSIQFQMCLWKVRRQLPKPDVIVSNFAGLFGNVFLKWKRRYGTKVIYDILDLWPEGFVDMGFLSGTSLITKILYHMEHKAYREADGLIFSFQGGKDYIVEKGWSIETGGDVDTRNIGYLNNGVDLETFDRQKAQSKYEDNDLLSGKFKVIYLGSISHFNGVDIIVETAKRLQDIGNTDIEIIVYGCGNEEDKMKEMVQDLGLNNIKFKGKVPKEYAPYILSQSDLTLFTFKNTHLLKYGVSPNKLFMYFASGKPVLSMIKPGYDLVESNKCGISVNNDPKEVMDAIIRMKQLDKDTYQVYCQNSRKTAEEYDYKNLVGVLIDKIESDK